MLARSYWLGARPFFGPGSVFAVPNGLTDVVRASVQRISGKLARTMANVPEEHPKPNTVQLRTSLYPGTHPGRGHGGAERGGR